MRGVSAAQIAQLRASRAFSLLIDVARPLAATALGGFVGLATADDVDTVADVAAHAPRLDERTPSGPSPRALGRTMRVGVLGEVRVQGARAPEVWLPPSFGGGFDLGDACRARRGA